MIYNDTSLVWYDYPVRQERYKWWAFGDVQPIVASEKQLPPFQIVRPTLMSAPITSFKVIRVPSNDIVDISLNILAAGLTIKVESGFDVVYYPASVQIDNDDLTPGYYYAVMSDGTNTWYSEVFCIVADLSEYVKVEYWHGENFTTGDGFIKYLFPFKNRLFFRTDIGKPSYQYQEEVSERNGRKFMLKQTSWKQYGFDVLIPEVVVDVLRLIPLHDFVEVTYAGITYSVDEFFPPDPQWQEQGHIAAVTLEFTTGTVNVVNGRGLTSTEYTATPGTCLTIDYTAVALIEENGAEFNGEYYEPAAGGANVPFQVNDYVLINTASGILLYQYDGTTPYVLVAAVENDTVYEVNGETYYEKVTAGGPFVTTQITGFSNATDPWSFFGNSFTGAGIMVEIWGRDANGLEFQVGVIQSNDINLTGFTVDVEGANLIAVQLRTASGACGIFQQTAWFELGGVGFWIIEDDFEVQ